MAQNGPINIKDLAKKYSSTELEKFKAISKADADGNGEKADLLISQLSEIETAHFELYIQDLAAIEERQKSIQVQLAEGKRKIDGLQASIAEDERQRDAVAYGYAAKMGQKTPSFQPSNTNGHSASNGHTATKEKTKKGGCTIM